MTIIIGHKTTIAQEYARIADHECIGVRLEAAPLTYERYLICMGYLAGKSMHDHNPETFAQTMAVNFGQIVDYCDQLFARNTIARVCIIGSESGIAGSYDTAYAGAKAAIHAYIETKKLSTPGQQLVGIAPTIVYDSAMTQRRGDIVECEKRGQARRRGKWLAAIEVARLAHFVLNIDTGTICNTVVRMHGGNW